MSNIEYISAADTAKLVRKALKKSFPGVKFYVNTSTYSMGASINVSWQDGPTTKEVDRVVKAYEGSDFDGSIDLKCHWDHWLLPDGNVQVAKGCGTVGSRGAIRGIDNPKPHPDAKLVSFLADYVFTERAHSRELVEQVGQRVHEKTGWDIPEIVESSWWAGRKERGKTYCFERGYGLGDTLDHNEHYNRELWATSAYEKPQAESEPEPNETRVEREGDWLWAYFPEKPDSGTREALKDLGGRFSGRRKAWYFTPCNCVPYSITEVEGLVRCLLFNEPKPDVRIQKLTDEDLFDPVRVARRNQRQAIELGQFN